MDVHDQAPTVLEMDQDLPVSERHGRHTYHRRRATGTSGRSREQAVLLGNEWSLQGTGRARRLRRGIEQRDRRGRRAGGMEARAPILEADTRRYKERCATAGSSQTVFAGTGRVASAERIACASTSKHDRARSSSSVICPSETTDSRMTGTGGTQCDMLWNACTTPILSGAWWLCGCRARSGGPERHAHLRTRQG